MNKEFIDRRFTQIESKISNLRYNLRGQSSKEEFEKNINEIEELVNDVKDTIERFSTPLRNG